MSQKERDRLKVLHEASKGQITQRQAGERLRCSDRQIRRLLTKLKGIGDACVIHGLRGRPSNQRTNGNASDDFLIELPTNLSRMNDMAGPELQ